MTDAKLEDYRFEIKALQLADYNNAYENGFTTRESWYNFIVNQDYDDIAQAIINISKRYQVPLDRVAYDFDHTMIMRVGKIIKNKNDAKTLK